MTAIIPALAQSIHIALMLLVAPAVAGLMDCLAARLSGRSGPPILLPWRDLVRLSRKTTMLPASASSVLLFAPAVSLGATLCAAMLVPSFTLGMEFAPLGDGLAIAALLSVARVAACLGALDTGSVRSAIAVQQASALAVLSEPALLLVVFSLALMAGTFNVDLIVGQQHEGTLLPAAAFGLAAICLLVLAFVGTGPVAAGMDQDQSGVGLAVSRAAVWLRWVVWIDLIGCLFVPAGIAGVDSSPLDWAIGLACWAGKLVFAALCLAAIRTFTGRIAHRHMSGIATIAALLALVAIVIAMADTGPA